MESLPNARQSAYIEAIRRGFAMLRRQTPERSRLARLGIQEANGESRWFLVALGQEVRIDLRAEEITVADRGVRQLWMILILHYVAANPSAPDGELVSFAGFPDAEIYANVFAGRIVGRFLQTAGVTAPAFDQAAAKLGTRLPVREQSYEFLVLPGLPLRITRSPGDEEIPAGATITFRRDARELLAAEDRVVAAELLLDALAGKGLVAG